MRLTTQDKMECLRAAYRAVKANDLPGLADWVASLGDLETDGGKDGAVPAYTPPKYASVAPYGLGTPPVPPMPVSANGATPDLWDGS